MARNKVAEKTVTEGGVEINFMNDEVLVANLSELDSAIVTQLALHGLSQKLGDSYAGSGGDLDEAVKMAKSVWARLQAGEWKAAREGGSGQGKVTDLARALAEVAGKEIPEAVAKLDEMGKAEKSALRKHPKVAAVLARLSAERAAEKLAEAEDAGELAIEF